MLKLRYKFLPLPNSQVEVKRRIEFHSIICKQLFLFSDKLTLFNLFCFPVNDYKKTKIEGPAADVGGGEGLFVWV